MDTACRAPTGIMNHSYYHKSIRLKGYDYTRAQGGGAGCPSCLGPSKEVGKISKQVAIEILSILNG